MNRVEILLAERGKYVQRKAINSPMRQGGSETVMYFVDLTPWGASEALPVSLPVVTILDQDDQDVTHGNHVATVTINAKGTGYSVDEIVTIEQAGSSGDATFKVLTIDGGGGILTLILVDVGYDYAAGAALTTVGGNDDATVDITVTDAELIVKASVAVAASVEIQFTIANVTIGDRYRVYIKGTIDSLIGECWTYLDGEK